MEAVLFQDWSVAPEGHTTTHYKAGDVLAGKAAQLALDAGVAFDPREETKVVAPPETKAKRGRPRK